MKRFAIVILGIILSPIVVGSLPMVAKAAPCDFSSTSTNACSETSVPFLKANSQEFYECAQEIAPVIPRGLLQENGCNPSQYNMNVVRFFAFKTLYAMMWVAGAFAIIYMIYVGILYILAYANEGNAKKGKNIILMAITGLIIVIMAKIIVYTSVTIFADQNARDTVQSNPFKAP